MADKSSCNQMISPDIFEIDFILFYQIQFVSNKESYVFLENILR